MPIVIHVKETVVHFGVRII